MKKRNFILAIKWLAAVLMIIMACVSVSAEETEFISNGDFETDTLGWVSSGGVSLERVSGGAEDSGYCAKVRTGVKKSVYQNISLDNETWYELSVWARVDSGTYPFSFVVEHSGGALPESVLTISEEFVVNSSWKKFTYYYRDFDLRNEMSGDIYPVVGEPSASNPVTFYFDKLSVKPINKCLVNGDFENPHDVTGWGGEYFDSEGNSRTWENLVPTWTSDESHSGNGSAKVDITRGNAQRCGQLIKLNKYKYYTFSVWVKLADTEAAKAQVIIQNINGAAQYFATDTPVNNKEWTQLKFTKHWSDAGEYVIFLRMAGEGLIDYYFDDFEIIEHEYDDIHFFGEKNVVIPVSGAVTENYTGCVSGNVNGETSAAMGEKCSWSVLSGTNSDITFDETLGKLTVTSKAKEGTLHLRLSSRTLPELYKEYEVNIISQKTNLQKRLSEAKETYNSSTKNIDGSKARFLAAITAAEKKYSDVMTEETAQSVCETLDAAQKAYLEGVEKDLLYNAIEKANELNASAAVGVLSGNVSEADKQIFTEKIKKAQEIADKPDISRLDSNKGLEIIEGASDKFKRSLVPYHVFYVDNSNGNDINDGTLNAPFKTLEKAKSAVSEISSDMNGDIIVYIRSGVYTVDSVFNFGIEDSGKNGYSVLYKAYNGDGVMISGGKRVTGWQVHDSANNIYKAYVGDVYARGFYINGERQIRARKDIDSSEWVSDNGEYGYISVPLEFSYLADIKNLSDVEFVYKQVWTNSRCIVSAVETVNGKLKIKMNPLGWKNAKNKGSTSVRNPIYMENAYEFIDMAGEWYLDKSDGYIYYKTDGNINLNECYAVLPSIDEEIMTVKGNSAQDTVNNIIFDGITFSYNTYNRPSEGYGISDAQDCLLREQRVQDHSVPAAIRLEYARNVDFVNCEFSHIGTAAVKLEKAVSDCTIKGNRFYDISAHAVIIGNVAGNGYVDGIDKNNNWNPVSGYELKNNDIVYNYIENIGTEFGSASAISLAYPMDMEVAYNTIRHTPYSGLHIGYGWTNITSAMKNVQIHHNYISDVMYLLVDGGGIYTLGGTSGTTENPNMVYENFISDVGGYGGAIYNDAGSSNWIISRNVSDLKSSPAWDNDENEHRWMQLWSAANNNMTAYENYSAERQSWKDVTADGNNNRYGKIIYEGDEGYQSGAEQIIESAGLTADYDYLTNYVKTYTELTSDNQKSAYMCIFDNRKNTAQTGMVISAQYSGNGILLDCKTEKFNVLPYKTALIDVETQNDYLNTRRIKTFMWNEEIQSPYNVPAMLKVNTPKNHVSISGGGFSEGDTVTCVILAPGYSDMEEVNSDNVKDAYYYIAETTADSTGGYEFEFQISDNDKSGVYNVYIGGKNGEIKKNGNFRFIK